MRYLVACAVWLVVAVADAQPVAFVFDLSEWRAKLVGVPVAVETDHRTDTTEWLIRLSDVRPLGATPTWSFVVVQFTPTGPCFGTPFHTTDAQHTEGRLIAPSLWLVREPSRLVAYTLMTPRCPSS